MKNIKQIRESYDFVTDKSIRDQRNLDALVEAGLFEERKLPVLKKILESSADKMSGSEKRLIVNLLESLIVQFANQDLSEAKGDYLSKYDPRGPKGQPSDSELPPVIILKRKAIRVYPDHQKVALYYAQSIDRYVSIPYGGNHVMTVNEETDDDKKRPVQKKKKQIPLEKREDLTMADLPEIRKYLIRNTFTSQDPLRAAMINLGTYSGIKSRLKKASQIKKPERIEPQFKDIPKKSAPKALPATASSPVSKAAEGIWKQRRLEESFKEKIEQLKEAALKRRDEPTESGGRYSGPTRTMGGADFMPGGGYGLTIGKQQFEVGRPANLNSPLFRGLRGKTFSRINRLQQKNVNPFNKSLPQVGTSVDAWGKDTSKNKVVNDLQSYLRKKETEKNIQSDIERTRKAEARKIAKKGFGTDSGSVNVPVVSKKEKQEPKAFLEPPKDPNKGIGITVLPNGVVAGLPVRSFNPSDQARSAQKAREDEEKKQQAAQQTAQQAKQQQKKDNKKDDKKRRTKFRLPDISFPSSPGAKEPGPSYKFGITPVISTPTPVSNRASVDRWMDIINRKANQAMLRENQAKDDEDDTGTATRTADDKPVYNFRRRPKVSVSKATTTDAAVQRWMERIGRQANQAMLRQDQQESVLYSIQNMVENNISESTIIVGEQSITINNTVAKKIISLHESMNKKNKKKMEEMLNESASSFNKVLTFAVRH